MPRYATYAMAGFKPNISILQKRIEAERKAEEARLAAIQRRANLEENRAYQRGLTEESRKYYEGRESERNRLRDVEDEAKARESAYRAAQGIITGFGDEIKGGTSGLTELVSGWNTNLQMAQERGESYTPPIEEILKAYDLVGQQKRKEAVAKAAKEEQEKDETVVYDGRTYPNAGAFKTDVVTPLERKVASLEKLGGKFKMVQNPDAKGKTKTYDWESRYGTRHEYDADLKIARRELQRAKDVLYPQVSSGSKSVTVDGVTYTPTGEMKDGKMIYADPQGRRGFIE